MPRERKAETFVGKKFGATVGDRGYLMSLVEKQQAIQAEIQRLGDSICRANSLPPGTTLTLEGDFWVVVKDAPHPAPAVAAPVAPAAPKP